MTTYLVKRFLQSVVFTFIASLLVFTFLVYAMPDSPGQVYARFAGGASDATSNRNSRFFDPFQTKETLERIYKLDKPWPLNFILWLYDPSATVRYNRYMSDEPAGIDIAIGDLHIRGSGILTGEFGIARINSRIVPINELLSGDWGNTAWLVGLALLVTLVVGVPLGMMQSVRHRSMFDHSSTFVTTAGLSIPMFVMGLMMIIFLGVIPVRLRLQLGWDWLPNLPGGGIGRAGISSDWKDRLYHLILPVTALAIPQIAIVSRYIKFSMLDVLGEDYIRTALAIGVSRTRVVARHAFRNAIIPAVTVVSLILPALASGAILVESVFNYPGMGQLYFQALGGCVASVSLMQTDRPPCPPIGPIDYPMAILLTTFLVLVTGLASFAADVLYGVVDPRIHLNEGRRG